MNNFRSYTSSHFRRLPKSLSIRRKVPWWDQIHDPGSEIVSKWNHIFLVACMIAMFLDPLYLYLPIIGGDACMKIDIALGVWVTFARTFTDLFFFLHIFMKFRTAFVAPSSRVFGRGELVMDPRAIAIRYLKSNFVVDLAAALPLPQVSHTYIIFIIYTKDFSWVPILHRQWIM